MMATFLDDTYNSTATTDACAKKTDELCTLFANTLSALASDAAALRQLQSLATAVVDTNAGYGGAAFHKNSEDSDGDNAQNHNDENNENGSTTTTGSTKRLLIQVDNAVTELEAKVRMLQEIVSEEKQSLKDMASVRAAAQAQNALLEEMAARVAATTVAATSAYSADRHCEDTLQGGQDEEKAVGVVASTSSTTRTAPPRRQNGTAPSVSTTLWAHPAAADDDGTLSSGAKRVRVARPYRDSMDPRDKQHSRHQQQQHSHSQKSMTTPSAAITTTTTAPSSSSPSSFDIHLKQVTQDEWNAVSRTVRGRITLAVVNDAIRDIQKVFLKKYAVLAHHNKQQHHPQWHHAASRPHPQYDKTSESSNYAPSPSSSVGQLELQQALLNSHRELQVNEHGQRPWVSEQDLRQCCAFFRNGESTARAILLIIRTVGRLKQVPAKHSQVTYVCV